MIIPESISQLFITNKAKINKVINEYALFFTRNYKGIDSSLIKKYFWKYIKNENLHAKHQMVEWYHSFAKMLFYFTAERILCIEKRIDDKTESFFLELTQYLFNRTMKAAKYIDIPYLEDISNNIPNKNEDQIYQLMSELNERRIEGNLLSNIINDKGKTIKSKIRHFKEEFNQNYGIFENTCYELSQFWGKKELKNKTYDKNMTNIFQMHVRNERTPPQFTNDILINLKHIRNACAHARITQFNENQIKIVDMNKSKINYEITTDVSFLDQANYLLLTCQKSIEAACQMIIVGKEITDINKRYTVNIKCPNCRKRDIIFWPPWQTTKNCRKCKKKFKK